ncbi:glycosyltransferase family 2 protein [Nocardiopsis sp. FIRDI 009]|uniref:glycosyltransferase family 2 protein n=1 Tax=Nocardiopsis sp. FIRDI 009 TaxID=714197 RepID=UPI001E501317|nr:glycosyltransferase family 2 protein [Nocardiopsis sp. FIRDI 009]
MDRDDQNADSAVAGNGTVPRVKRNDYGSLVVPALGSWTPRLSVSVVIPAHGHADKLELVLASLAAQSYPSHLMEVIVVDDGSNPPLSLPEIRPERTRIIPPAPGGWGSPNAVNTGVAASEGDVVLRLDSDMLVYHDHVESQMRWHHVTDHAVAMGHKLFVDYEPGCRTAEEVHKAVLAGKAGELFDRDGADPHWVDRVILPTDNLRSADHTAYRVFVGATGSLHRALFDEAGGLNTRLLLGGDSEFAYRVAQQGAVFVPDLDSSSWHLGRSQMQSRQVEGRRYRIPYVANLVPEFDPRRKLQGRHWEVPFVDVVLEVGDSSADDVDAAIVRLLAGNVDDIRITLVGDWPEDDGERRDLLDDPFFEPRLTLENYRCEPRVRFADAVPEPDPRVPFRLRLSSGCRPTRNAVQILTDTANEERVGLIEIDYADGATARLERNSAFARARRVARDGEDLDRVVAEVHGTLRVDAEELGVRTPGSEYKPIKDWQKQLNEAREQAAEYREQVRTLKRRLARSPLGLAGRVARKVGLRG